MLRYRRYRVFLFFTAVLIFLVYTLAAPAKWEQTARNVGHVREQLGFDKKTAPKRPQQEPLRPPDVKPPVEKLPPPPIEPIPKPVQQLPPTKVEKPALSQAHPHSRPSAVIIQDSAEDGRQRLVPGGPSGELIKAVIAEAGEGRKEEDPLPADAVLIRWEPPEEHFPVAETIQMPVGTPKPIPKIQHEFAKESSIEHKARLEKLEIIKDAFLHAWNGYKENAWGKDELTPVTASYKNPFNGWGATLVDSLDTLWIMGLKQEFEEAVTKVKSIDFQTSRRGDIPLFETVIRYLGGLLGAYDVSGGQYRVLLDKAVELGEILIGAFDTPNRMPITFYQWKPTFTSQSHRASSHAVLAELGTLSIEFTRLSQITKEPKYYDAIARITDALQEWQNHTRLPGMWPIRVDASGCERIQYRAPSHSDGTPEATQLLLDKSDPDLDTAQDLEEDEVVGQAASEGAGKTGSIPESVDYVRSDDSSDRQNTTEQPRNVPIKDNAAVSTMGSPGEKRAEGSKEEPRVESPAKSPHLELDIQPSVLRNNKRQLDNPITNWESEKLPTTPVIPSPFQAFNNRTIYSPPPVPECIPHGLGSTSFYGMEEFTLGSMADSTYEYFPKEYILLGGLVDQYREMFEWSMDVAKEKLLFRVMLPDEEREILVSGAYEVSVSLTDDVPGESKLSTTGSHLTCFVGGMFALGAKIFNRPQDLEIAEKLADGCVWAYEMTTTGIMPESFIAIACEDRTSCPWNESKWWGELDPNRDWREESYIRQMEIYESALEARKLLEAHPSVDGSDDPGAPVSIQTASPVPPEEAARDSEHASIPAKKMQHKRQVVDSSPKSNKQETSMSMATRTSLNSTGTATDPLHTLAPLFSPVKPPTHEEYVKKRIEEERIPPGISYITSNNYLLRPEALESVFYLYRITGSPYWREKGWNMITAILQHTETEFGHSAIDDVTKTHPKPKDSMESFWLAETLKYAWLLFEEEDRWSLDHWVLNTEAHLLKRPDAPRDAH